MSLPERAPADILQTLAERLSEDTLLSLFPETSPAFVRSLLLKIAASLPTTAPKAEKKSLPALEPPVTEPTALRGRLFLFTDGASRGNPGVAGAGAVLFNDRGEIIHEKGAFLGTCTNNVAEYRALLLGLGEAERLGATELAIRVDSELLTRQIQGVYQVKDLKLRPLFKEVMTRLGRFRKFEINHVPRAENQRADQLANEAIDRARTGGKYYA